MTLTLAGLRVRGTGIHCLPWSIRARSLFLFSHSARSACFWLQFLTELTRKVPYRFVSLNRLYVIISPYWASFKTAECTIDNAWNSGTRIVSSRFSSSVGRLKAKGKRWSRIGHFGTSGAHRSLGRIGPSRCISRWGVSVVGMHRLLGYISCWGCNGRWGSASDWGSSVVGVYQQLGAASAVEGASFVGAHQSLVAFLSIYTWIIPAVNCVRVTFSI